MEKDQFNLTPEEMEEIEKSRDAARYGIFLASRKQTVAALAKEIEEMELNISKHRQNVEYYAKMRDNEELVEMLGGQKAYDDFQSKVELAQSKIAEFEARIQEINVKKREAEEDIYRVMVEDGLEEVEPESEAEVACETEEVSEAECPEE